MEARWHLARANAVVFLDLPPRLYLPRALGRALVGAVVGRAQAPGCRERLNSAFRRYALAWRREQRGMDLALLDGFGRTVLVPGNDDDVRRVPDDLLRVGEGSNLCRDSDAR